MDTAKLITDGARQAVQFPAGYGFVGNQVYIKRVGSAIILLPIDDPWRPLIDSLDGFSDDFMAEREQPPHQVRDTP